MSAMEELARSLHMEPRPTELDDGTFDASLGAILAVTTGIVVAPLSEWYALQDFLVGHSLMTHDRVGSNADYATARLLEQFPRLAEVAPPSFADVPTDDRERACRAWVASVAEHIGWDRAAVIR